MTYDQRLEHKPHIYKDAKRNQWCVAYKPVTPTKLVMLAIEWVDTTHRKLWRLSCKL